MTSISFAKRAALALMCSALLCLSGCDKGDTWAPPPQEETVVKWLIYGERSRSAQEVTALFNERLQDFFPGTVVEFDIVERDEYKEYWDTMLASNQTLDLAWIGSDMFNYSEEVKKGSFLALDYLLETSGQNLLEQIPAELWSIARREGKAYCVPLQGAAYVKDYAIVANEQFGSLDGIGRLSRSSQYSDKACYDEIERYILAVDAQGKESTGISPQSLKRLANKGLEGIYGLDSPFVIKRFDKTPVVYNKYELDEYKLFFATADDWYKKGILQGLDNSLLGSGASDGLYDQSTVYLDEYGENHTVAGPVLAQYERAVQPLQDGKYIGYESCRNAVVLPRTAANPKRAIEIVNLLNSPQGVQLYRLLVNGVENIHYERLALNTIERFTDTKGKLIYGLCESALGNAFFNYECAQGKLATLKMYNDEATRSPLMGFELDTRMIVVELQKVNLVVSKYAKELYRGSCKNWGQCYDELIAKLKIAGSDKVKTEIQKQIDAFIAAKRTLDS